MKKKFLIVLLTLVCIFCLSFGLTACDNGGESTHSHVEAEAVRENEIAATCTAEGSYDSVVYCSVCNEELSRETLTIPKTEHIYNTGVVTTEPTCNTNGIKTYTCTVCGDTYTETIAANGHTYNSDKVCTVCGAEKVSEGLEYVLSTDKTYYTVSSIGTCVDTDLIIPSSYNGLPVTAIGEYAFNSCTSIISVTIPDSITSIGEYAFIYCYRLVEVYNLSSLKIVAGSRVQGYAGYYAKNVYTATEGESHFFTLDNCLFIYDDDNSYYFVSYNGTDTDITLPVLENGFEISSYTFYCDTEITSVVIPDNVTAIGDYSFYGCTSLKEIDIPDSVLTIGNYAFDNCASATKLYMGCGITDIGSSAFYNCTALTEIYYNVVTLDDLSRANCIFYDVGKEGNGIKLTIGEDVKYIPSYLFCPYVLFSQIRCYLNITEIEFDNNCLCESIGENAFAGCRLNKIIIPDSVISIGEYAFYECTALTAVNFTENSQLETIGDYAFYCCSALKEITIPTGVTVINYGLFLGCHSLETIVIPDSVTSIGFNAFNDCYSLESVTIPASVTYIGAGAFCACDSISITFENINGWYVTETEGASDGIAIDVTDASQNAKYFKETYCAYYWYRSDS